MNNQMKKLLKITGVLLVLQFSIQTALSADDKVPLAELDAYWAKVSKAVREGDFEGYRDTCHEQGVLVSGSSQTSYPLSQALTRWKQGFLDTKAGNLKANVEFRFSKRLRSDTTAHETGMFLYTTENAEGERTKAYIHFEGLLVKRDGWKIMMEYQKSEATAKEWEKLR
jgi:hypothetical protein